ncbi:MAG: TonB-dependent receptor [Bacteroidales bacterium]|nr:TonB-dependent receptor [Bacteroidales bacterium]
MKIKIISIKYCIPVFIFSAFTGLSCVFPQNGSISGIITDKNNGDIIPYATVAIIPQNNESSIKVTNSGDDGNFLVENLASGVYDVMISFIGYTADTISDILITEQQQRINIGNIRLSAYSVAIDEVIVKAAPQTITSKIDRITYRTGDFETARGGNAVDVLNKLPSISVDPNGMVSVRGTPDFMVYLNGKPSQMEPSLLLAQISADAIESIDVIVVPTAKYDAQGKGGIINITTKKTGTEGLSVSANGLIGGAPWGNATSRLGNFDKNDNRLGGSLNLLYMKSKIAVYGGLYYNKKNVNGSRPAYARLLQDNGSYLHMVADGDRPEWYEYYTANAGIDYQLSNNSRITMFYFYGNRTEGRSALYLYHNYFGDIDKNPVIDVPVDENWIYNPNKRNRIGIFHTVNLDYTKKFNNESDLKISLLYEHSELKRNMENRHFAYETSTKAIGDLKKHFQQNDYTPLDGYWLSIDYKKELSNGHLLELGLQPQYFQTSGTFSYDTLDVLNEIWGDFRDFENAIEFTRGVYSGYVDYSGNIGKIDLIAGLRLEYTDQAMDIENPDYFTIFERITKPRYEVSRLDWFPSLHLNYGYSEMTKLSFAVSRRISRPVLSNMTPFLYREHFEVYVVGDPALKPEYLTNFDLSFNQKIGKQNFTLTGFYRTTDNIVYRVNTVYPEENVLIRSYTNSGNSRSIGMEYTASVLAGKFLRFLFSSSLYNYRVEGDIFGYKENNRSTNWSIKGNASFIFSGSLVLTADFDMKSATVTTQGRNEMLYMANLAVNYTPQRLPGLGFTLKTLDILRSNSTRLNTRAYNIDGVQIFYQETEYARYGPIVEFSVSYDLNMEGKSGKKTDSNFGREQF